VSSQNAPLASASALHFNTQAVALQIPNFKMCNFCPIYEKLGFVSDVREGRISISKKFLSAVPHLMPADDEVQEAGDVTFIVSLPKLNSRNILDREISRRDNNRAVSVSSEVVMARIASRHRTVHVEKLY
jgi:hypothetical protein